MKVLEPWNVRGVGFEPTDLYGRDLKSRAFGQLGYPRADDGITTTLISITCKKARTSVAVIRRRYIGPNP